YSDWKFLNGLRTAPATGLTAATLTFAMPSTPGAYTLRFFSNNTYTLLTTANVTVNDITAPVISAVVASSITSSGATVSWTTNETSDSQVDYGPTTAYGSSSALNASLVTAHTVSLTGLTGSTLCHFRVRSRDA